jgi:hypothetical protein
MVIAQMARGISTSENFVGKYPMWRESLLPLVCEAATKPTKIAKIAKIMVQDVSDVFRVIDQRGFSKE